MKEEDNNQHLTSQQKRAEKLHGPFLAWLVLTISLILTICAWFISTEYVKGRAQDKFDFKAERINDDIKGRMLLYEQVLRGGVAFFDSSSFVSREEWKTYVDTLNLEKNWPGIQGLGYSIPIKKEKLKDHISEIRSQGFPDFTVKPEGERDFYTSIIYLEPFDWRNKRAFGYDMWSNEMRRKAMKESVETGEAKASGLITLVQETEKDIKKGFLLYLPVYKQGMSIDTKEQRFEALEGWVYAAFRTNDLMEGILAKNELDVDQFTEMEIYDGSLSEENLLFSSTGKSSLNSQKISKYSRVIEQNVQGRKRFIKIYENDDFVIVNKNLPNYIAIGGLIFDILLFYVIFALSSVQRKAVTLAKQMSVDLDEQNKALKDNEAQTKAIVDHTVDGIISINKEGIVLTYNKSCKKLFGYESDEVIGQNVKMLMPEPHQSQHDNYLRRYLETGIETIIGVGREVDCLRKDGTTFPADLSISVIESGDEPTFIGLIRDISIRKENEERMKAAFEELVKTTEELEKTKQEAILASKAKSEFLANMSHEIRTPMTAILGYIDLLKDKKSEITEEAMEHVNVIEKNGDYLLNIINDILDLSKIEADKLELEYAPMDVFELVFNLQSLLQAKLVEKNLDFKLDYSFPIPDKVMGDQTRVRQILINLIGNAIKFTQKGSVTLKTSWNEDTSELSFDVIDTGIGMTEEQQSKVFQSFQQADNSITRKFGGTGLGLAITKRLCEMMGGKICVSSEFGKGTTFSVKINANAIGSARHKNVPVKKEKTVVNLKPKSDLSGRVLLVDDNMTNLTLISKVLKKMNLDVECCMNGQEAVHILLDKEEDFQIVLMDVQMPVMDGLTAAGILKENNYDKPVIALTANTMSGDKEKCLAAGYNDFASKPINKNELFRIISSHISES